MSTANNKNNGVSVVNKILLAALGSWASGHPVGIRMRGSLDEMKTVERVLLATRNFDKEIKRSGATVESVMKKLNEKAKAAEAFEKIIGVPWPL